MSDPNDPSTWDPNPTTGGGDYADHPDVADLVTRVVASINPSFGEEVDTAYGKRTPLKVERLVVFPKDGNPDNAECYEDYAIWQSVLQDAMRDRAVVIGRITRPKRAYLLEPVTDQTKLQAADILRKRGWLPGEPRPKVVEAATPGYVDTRDDDGGF